MMKIRYENTLEDIVAFNRYHFAHSPALQTQRVAVAVVAWALPVALVVPVLLAWFSAPRQGDNIGLAIEVVLLAVLLGFVGLLAFFWAWIVRRVFAWSIDWQTRRLLKEGANKGLLG